MPVSGVSLHELLALLGPLQMSMYAQAGEVFPGQLRRL